jgi:hypothetical protein
MKLSLSLLIAALGVTGVQSHGTEVRACVTTAGNLRFYIQHWHGDLSSTGSAGSMNIQSNHVSGTPINTLFPSGFLNTLAPAQLPDCADGNPPTLVTTCSQSQHDWVYYDFPTSCGSLVDYTLLAGNTVVLEEGCGHLYPAQYSGTFFDKAPPQIDINGVQCSGGAGQAVAVTSATCSGTVANFQVTVSDDCDANPTYQISHQSGSTFKAGATTVTVTAQDNTGKTTTCSFPVIVTTSANCGAFGDPHFKTWNGDKYDFHGVCDLVLLHNPSFANGVGMDIHLRTKRTRQWSYVESAAVRIGQDSLEVTGGKTENKYWINADAGKELTHDTELDSKLSGYPIHFKKINDKSHEFTINLGSDEKITISTWNGFVRVNVGAGEAGMFAHSLGLMGSYDLNGAKIARDGKTAIIDNDVFGQEWQVSPEEVSLFHNLEGPQAPMQCEIPSAVEMRRRLAESFITRQDAEIACSRVDAQDFEVCVFDVMATNDKESAGAY